MKRKKFKTVSGYLRSMESNLHLQQFRAETRGQPAISDEDGERQIINALLPQIGITDLIGPDECPCTGVKRLHGSATDVQLRQLQACLKWLNRPKVISAKIVGVRTVGPDAA